MQVLDVGELATLNSHWWKLDGSPAEPSAITLTITKPDGTTVVKVKADCAGTSSLTPPGVLDVWSYSQLMDVPGAWRYRFEGTVDGATVTQPDQVVIVGVPDASTSGPCEPWCTWGEVEACQASDFGATLNESQRESCIDTASSILFDLSRRTYTGICSTTRSLCLACMTCWPAFCHCEPVDGLDLGTKLVWGAWDVVVDGVTLAPSAYTIIDRRYLTRLDGQRWPRGTDVSDPTKFSASWAYGRAIPPPARRAAALFAAEVAKSCMGQECQIPQRISSIVREGVTYPVLDSLSMIAEGRTGIALTDLWIVADAKGRKQRPGMFAPGAHSVRRIA